MTAFLKPVLKTNEDVVLKLHWSSVQCLLFFCMIWSWSYSSTSTEVMWVFYCFFPPLVLTLAPSLFVRTKPDAPRVDSDSPLRSSPLERPAPLKAKRSHRRADPDAAHRYVHYWLCFRPRVPQTFQAMNHPKESYLNWGTPPPWQAIGIAFSLTWAPQIR